MVINFRFLVSLILATVTANVIALDTHVLTVRQMSSTGYEAAISYNSNICNSVTNPASSIQISGSEIRIESPEHQPDPCVGPIPPIIFVEVTANIGELEPGDYTVTWEQAGSFLLSTPLLVPAPELQAAYPETGSWYNPQQSGSGLNLEIQNGVLVGYYYGYDANGLPEWQLLNGPLVRSELAGVQWQLETTLMHFQDGNCIGCGYSPPEGPTDGPTIKLEFQQRNYMRLTIGDNPSQVFLPIMYGSAGHKYFFKQTPYVFPEFGVEPDEPAISLGTNFTFVIKPNSTPPAPWSWKTQIIAIGKGSIAPGGPNEGKLVYTLWHHAPPPGQDVPSGQIICDLDADSNQPACSIGFDGREYIMPIANLGDSRFFGEAEDGATIEAYRIDYD